MRIGLISDTHGRVDARVHARLEGVDEIVHAGDVCAADVIVELEAIAPLHCVRGNCDWGETGDLPAFLVREYEGVSLLATHILGRGREHSPREEVAQRIEAAGARVVVFGHSHRPDLFEREGVWYVNPGSVSEARGHTLGLAMMTVDAEGVRIVLMDLDGRVTARLE